MDKSKKALIVVLVSEIIIKATINISILQRTKDFGILRCLGASKAHLKKLVIKCNNRGGTDNISIAYLVKEEKHD